MLKDTSCNLIAEMINAMSVRDMYEFVIENGTREQTTVVYPREGLIEELSNNSNLEELLDGILYGGHILPEHQWYTLVPRESRGVRIRSLSDGTVRYLLEKIVVEILDAVGIHTPHAYSMLYDYTERHFTQGGENND